MGSACAVQPALLIEQRSGRDSDAELHRRLDAVLLHIKAGACELAVVLLRTNHGGAGHQEAAVAALTDALAIGKESGERWWEAEIHRLRGTFMLSRRRFAESEACFRRSIRIAQRQQAKSLELRGAMSLAQLWRDRGQHERAHNLLAPVYGWFTEGFNTLDLKEAKALLNELH